MKKITFVLLTLALLFMFVGTVPSVQAQKFPGYVSGTQVQNLTGNLANVTLTYYQADDGSAGAGSVIDTVPSTIDPNSSKTFFPAMTSSFNGSMVISSDQPLAAVTNVQNSAKTAGAAYVGASAGSTTLSIPLLMKGNGTAPNTYDTWFSVQNAGSTDAHINITYSDCASAIPATIKANASKTFYQKSEACHTTKVFSAQVTSDQPLVSVVMEENPSKMLAYTAFPSTGTELLMPLVNANNSGITTGIQIQNTSGTDTSVELSFSPSQAGTACTETQTIPSHQSKTFALAAFSANNSSVTTTCVAGQKFVGSAKVTKNTGNGQLVAIVNQTKTTYGEAYGAFIPANATPKLVMPLIMDRNGGSLYSTGFSVMNAGTAATYVKCTFSGNKPTTYVQSKQLQPSEALTAQQNGQIVAGFVGSGVCAAYSDAAFTTVDPNAKIVAVVNELGLTTADRLLVYEGINVAP